MKRMLRVFALACLPLFAYAQNARPVVAVLPFEALGAGKDETKAIENLVQSYISELDEYTLIATSDRDRILSELEFAEAVGSLGKTPSADLGRMGTLLSADFLLTGSLSVLGNEAKTAEAGTGRLLTLEVVKVRTSEKKSVSSVHPGMSDLALNVRSLVHGLFEADALKNTRSNEGEAAALSEEAVLGTWRGDKGIEIVRISKGGSAQAYFTSGARMELSYRIDKGELILRQASPNTDRYYQPLPYKVAARLAETAEPMEWRFRLYSKGNTLRGTKTATAVRYDRDVILEIIRGSAREAEWNRASR